MFDPHLADAVGAVERAAFWRAHEALSHILWLMKLTK